MAGRGRPDCSTGRCEWAADDALLVEYHDKEWGVPEHDDQSEVHTIPVEAAKRKSDGGDVSRESNQMSGAMAWPESGPGGI